MIARAVALMILVGGCASRPLAIPDPPPPPVEPNPRYVPLDTASAACLTMELCVPDFTYSQTDCVDIFSRLNPITYGIGNLYPIQCYADALGDCKRAGHCPTPLNFGPVGGCGNGASYRCEGALITCGGTISIDCGDLGASCSTDPFYGGRCVGAGPACTASSGGRLLAATLRCDGSVLVYCASGFESQFDCATLGATCVPDGQRGFDCRLGQECDPLTFDRQCSNGQLSYCESGKISELPWSPCP